MLLLVQSLLLLECCLPTLTGLGFHEVLLYTDKRLALSEIGLSCVSATGERVVCVRVPHLMVELCVYVLVDGVIMPIIASLLGLKRGLNVLTLGAHHLPTHGRLVGKLHCKIVVRVRVVVLVESFKLAIGSEIVI